MKHEDLARKSGLSVLENIQLLIPLIAIKTQLSNYKSAFINVAKRIITQESSVKKMLTRN